MTEPIEARDPRTGDVDYRVTPPTDDELDRVEQSIRTSQEGWREEGLEHRLDVLQRWKDEIEANRERLTDRVAADTGRRGISATEVDALVSMIDRVCEQAPAVLTPDPLGEASISSIRLDPELVPYPLVGVVSPWNFPLLLSAIDTVPALAAGCGVIVKPSEVTPRFVEPLRETIAAVPELDAVLEYVPGAGQTGAAVVDRADAVAFTGSVETGKKIARQAAGSVKPTFLELGGNDPAIVLAGADVDAATSAILWASTVNTGQGCQSIERVYVHEGEYDRFVDQLLEKAADVGLAYPDEDSGRLGPFISREQADIVQRQLDDAAEKGATIRHGGKIETHGGGRWLRPTVLTDVDHSMAVATEETFGPVIPVASFETADDAVELANDTVYGLSGAVFGETEAAAIDVGRRIEAGAISINDASLTAVLQEGEKQAFKQSGLGQSRFGPKGIDRFLRRKMQMVKTDAVPDPWWYDVDESWLTE
ncbi:aldehyde dehydrogenase family protein [Halovivax limisalsi]|uniref:aldehyde dehydrogenase family protein n=1 Tax=Halovivax limisalsi TaxID=1453760 RepID=UPI001FFD57B4|nr:aldehyde dehydrogenase family protein [Halovivax limisalsi]